MEINLPRYVGFSQTVFRLTMGKGPLGSRSGNTKMQLVMAVELVKQVIRREIGRYVFLSTVFLRRFWLEVLVLVQKPTWRLAAAPSAK